MPSPSKKGFLFWTVTLVAVLSALVLAASFPVVSTYRGKAIYAQRVEFDEAAASLFGDTNPYQEIGSPQYLVIEDKAALLPGKTKDGAQMVSENYLREKKVYPLQLKTVDFVGSLIQQASGAALVVSLLLLALMAYRRRKAKTT